jgi:hypothetical protein
MTSYYDLFFFINLLTTLIFCDAISFFFSVLDLINKISNVYVQKPCLKYMLLFYFCLRNKYYDPAYHEHRINIK